MATQRKPVRTRAFLCEDPLCRVLILIYSNWAATTGNLRIWCFIKSEHDSKLKTSSHTGNTGNTYIFFIYTTWYLSAKLWKNTFELWFKIKSFHIQPWTETIWLDTNMTINQMHVTLDYCWGNTNFSCERKKTVVRMCVHVFLFVYFYSW